MSADDRIRNRRTFRNPMLIMGAGMAIFFVFFGAYLLLDKDFLPEISIQFRNIFAVMVLLYGIFRGWRVYSEYF